VISEGSYLVVKVEAIFCKPVDDGMASRGGTC